MKTTYKIDPSHSTIGFSIKHMMIAKVHGAFEKFSGTLELNRENLSQSNMEVEIDASSINTHEPQRDGHLKSADFFDVEKYSKLTFKSTQVDLSSGDLKVKGELTIHGVTQSVILDVEGPTEEIKDPWGNLKIAISASTKIKRKDFGLTWNAALEAGGFLVGDDVSINIELQLVKQV